MGRLSCGRDAVSDRLGVVEGAVSRTRSGLVSYPCRIIRGTETGLVSHPCRIIRGTGTALCPVGGAAWTGGRSRVR